MIHTGVRFALLIGSTVCTFGFSDDYPNSKILIEPHELSGQLKSFVVLDARPQQKYSAGHIPGAIQVNADQWRAAFVDGKNEAAWSARIGALGIDNNRPVVVYDDVAGKDAARIWWILRYWGVRDVRLVNGFWHGWKSSALPTQIFSPGVRPVVFTTKRHDELAANKTQVLAASNTGGQAIQIVDARSLEEHIGKLNLNNKRPGHIPGSCHLDWTDLVDSKGTQRFRTPAELRQQFDRAHINLQKPIIAHCQSGGRASVMVFAISLMGGKNVANYHPSFGEWSADANMPVQNGTGK